MSSLFDSPEQEIPRDRWGRPLVVPLDGGKPEPYTRATTFAGTLEDTFGLTAWKERMTVLGMGRRPDLVMAASAASADDKRTLGSIAKSAQEAAGAGSAALTGTALHSFTERIDRGQELGFVPPQYVPDVKAYAELVERKRLGILGVEGFCVLDDYRVAGTYDRILSWDGVNYIGDLKTGNIDLGAMKIAIQLAVYAHAQAYDVAAAQRTPLPDVSQDEALVVHLPAGTGIATLHRFNIRKAWDDCVALSARVRELRSLRGKDWSTPAEVVEVAPLTITERIKAASTEEALKALWRENKRDWTPAYTAAASARLREITHN